MIVYAEDKKYPIFAACFQAEGQPLARQHRSSLACNYDLFLRHIPRRLISETLLYAPLPDDEMNDAVLRYLPLRGMISFGDEDVTYDEIAEEVSQLVSDEKGQTV